MQTYLCLKYHSWRGNQYIPGLHYTAYDDEAHRAFRDQAEDWVEEGIFQRVDGPSPYHAATNSKVAASGKIVKKET